MAQPHQGKKAFPKGEPLIGFSFTSSVIQMTENQTIAPRFLITDAALPLPEGMQRTLLNEQGWSLYAPPGTDSFADNGLRVWVFGYVLPRYSVPDGGARGAELVAMLWRSLGQKGVQSVKGIFFIVVQDGPQLFLFNDHLALFETFTARRGSSLSMATSIDLLIAAGHRPEVSPARLAVRTLLNRSLPGHTVFGNINRLKGAALLRMEKGAFRESSYWSYESLLPAGGFDPALDVVSFAELLTDNFRRFQEATRPDQHFITLTGGKDGRTALAVLLANGITPHGITYGHSGSMDAVYARKVALAARLPHSIITPPDTDSYFGGMLDRVVATGNPEISFHRAHRLYAMQELAAATSGSAALYTGYMAGEMMMGLFFDNLIFTDFLTQHWRHDQVKAGPVLSAAFHRPEKLELEGASDLLRELKGLDPSIPPAVQRFHALFEIGVPHHRQDVGLAQAVLGFPYPFFLDIDLLERLFKSRFNLFYTHNTASNPLRRYHLYYLNMHLQHRLAPSLDGVPFAKRGAYSTREYLRGPFYWSLVKSLRYITHRHHYPSSYTYGAPFREFVAGRYQQLLADSGHPIHAFFDLQAALVGLQAVDGTQREAAVHRFSYPLLLAAQLSHLVR